MIHGVEELLAVLYALGGRYESIRGGNPENAHSVSIQGYRICSLAKKI